MWFSVAKTSNLRDGYGMAVKLPNRRKLVALFRYDGKFFAVGDECTHASGALSEGLIDDFIVTCPWHGAQFDIRTGKGVGDLTYPDLPTFPVQVVGDDVQIDN